MKSDAIPHHLLDWLLAGDVAIQYQVYRDLLHQERPDLRARIATEGWGAQFLSARRPEGHWGRGFYQPKWISTHYRDQDKVGANCIACAEPNPTSPDRLTAC